jgi:NTP pyrophosphatase (non-canonical NTP hydrolase)
VGLTYEVHAEEINSLRDEVHALARAKGWYDKPSDAEPTPEGVAARVAMIHRELGEFLEAYCDSIAIGNDSEWKGEDGKPEGPATELGDVLMRLVDLAGWLRLDLGDAVVRKFAYNERRPYRHGGKAL